MHDCFFSFLADTPLISSRTALLGLGVGDPSKAPGRLEQIDSCNAKHQNHQPFFVFCSESCDELGRHSLSVSTPYIIFVLANRSATIFFFYFCRSLTLLRSFFLENGHGWMGQNSSRRLPESVFFHGCCCFRMGFTLNNSRPAS
jgi:hypothetical protein